MAATATGLKPSTPKQLPTPSNNFSHFADPLERQMKRAILQSVHEFMETKVQPIRCST